MPPLDWWNKPRKISVLVDNDSWILPHAQTLVDKCNQNGDRAKLCRTHEEIMTGGILFLLGCVHIAAPDVLQRNHKNLVIHESDLPKGRGFAPVGWQILKGAKTIPVCMLEATNAADGGPIIYRDSFTLQGHELLPEWRHLQGQKSTELCLKYLQEKEPLSGTPQKGEETTYPRRRSEDSRLDPNKSLSEQFELLRIVDNERFPAFFEYRGRKYKILILPDDRDLS